LKTPASWLLLRPPCAPSPAPRANASGWMGGYHLRAFAQRVEVGESHVRIMGSKGTLLRTLKWRIGRIRTQMPT
jgi:hypothetical protein